MKKTTFIHVGNRIYALDYIRENDDEIHAYASKKYIEDSMEYNKSNRLDKFNADEARRLSEKSRVNELQWVLQEIKRMAESTEGNDSLYLDKRLRDSTVYELKKRGFIVGISQYNPIKYLITW